MSVSCGQPWEHRSSQDHLCLQFLPVSSVKSGISVAAQLQKFGTREFQRRLTQTSFNTNLTPICSHDKIRTQNHNRNNRKEHEKQSLRTCARIRSLHQLADLSIVQGSDPTNIERLFILRTRHQSVRSFAKTQFRQFVNV